MKRVSQARVKRAKRLTERYADCHGIPFDEYRFHLPAKVSDWPTVVRVDDPAVCRNMHEWFADCWACLNRCESFGRRFPGERRVFYMPYPREAHHIAAGTKGRSDEFCNIAMLCSECHANANTAALPMGRILFLKFKHDRQHVDWVRLALLARRFLPALIFDNGETFE